MSAVRLAFAVAAAIGAGALVSGCGGNKPAFCAYVDAERSTSDLRQTYMADLERRARDAAAAGRRIRILVGTGAPLTESLVRVAAFDDLTSPEQQPDRDARLADLVAQAEDDAIDADLGIGSPSRGSSIAAGMTQLAVNGACAKGTLVAYTDGLQTVTISVYRDDIESVAGRADLVQRLRAAGAVADLGGADVEMPFGGLVKAGSILGASRKPALDDLFREWTSESGGGSFTWGH